MPDQWRNVSAHVQPLASGRPVAPGEACELSDDPHDRALRCSGAFVAAETATDYDAMRLEQLQALADGARLDVAGSGQGGAVVKADLVKALKSNAKKETT